MINDYLVSRICAHFPFQPTGEQQVTLEKLAAFLLSPASDALFLLGGYAGTGKTSLVGALVKTLDELGQKVILLAPTGRAAKVFASYAERSASTIHRKIYRQTSFAGEGYGLNDNLHTHTLFLVDEASMIANDAWAGRGFGTGRLLDDLIHYVYSGEGCRILLMGDEAQLPPVGEEHSPALSPRVLGGYGLDLVESKLTQVVRQADRSGILWNATRLRELMAEDGVISQPRIKLKGFADIRVVSGSDLIDALETCYGQDGVEETTIVCRSNKQANAYNNGIRSKVLWMDDELSGGDLLMVAKNNYAWASAGENADFIANGEMAMVRRVRRVHDMHGFRFAEATLRFPDRGDEDFVGLVLLDTLYSDSPSLSQADSERLFAAVLEDYVDEPSRRERMKKVKTDVYYNALQVKYAYAITCHKAQGGQWKNVFVDQGYVAPEQLTPDFYRWLYTAFTRATDVLYLINYPEELTER